MECLGCLIVTISRLNRSMALHNLPLNGMNRSCGQKIEESINDVTEIDICDDDIDWGCNLQIKVHIDLTKLKARV